MNGAPTRPYHDGPIEGDAVRCGNDPGQPILHVDTQSWVERELAGLGPSARTIRAPLRGNGAIVEFSAARHRVASDFA